MTDSPVKPGTPLSSFGMMLFGLETKPDISFFLPGRPQQQGSKTPWGSEANANLPPFRQGIKSAAFQQMLDGGFTQPHRGPCKLDVTFVFERPKSHFNSKGELKPTAPAYKQSTPDRDKLLRAVQDALTGAAVYDDALFVDGRTSKEYGEYPGTHVDVWFLS